MFLTGYCAEHAFVLAVECLNRAVRRLDPRLYFETLRIRTIIDGRDVKATKKVAIFLLYCDAPLPRLTLNLIESFKRSPFNLVVVSNKNLDAATTSQLLDRCCLLIERVNVGRDFGGYKDAISVVLRRFQEIERLVIANDSVFYFESGLDGVVAALDGPDDFIGVSEVLDHHYHVASFLISFGRTVIESAAFRRYWKRYRPIGTRRWAIFRGEGHLTATLVRSGFQPKVLFKAEHLRRHLRARSSAELRDLVALLPTEVRDEMRAQFDELARRLDDGSAGGAALDKDIADAIVGAIEARNQMHAGGFLFRKYLGLPIVKKDIVYREIYALEDVPRVLGALDDADLADVMADLRRRGTAAQLGMLRRVFYRHSAA